MKKAPHGGSNHLGMGKINRSGAEQDRPESKPIRRPEQRTKIVGIIDLVQQQETITLHGRQIIRRRHGRNRGHRDNAFGIFILAESMPLTFAQAVDIDCPRMGRQDL